MSLCDILDAYANYAQALEKAVLATVEGIADELSDKLYDICDAAISAAKSQANHTVRKWGSSVNRDNRAAGGLYWSTYKAVCRRDGVFSNANGSNNFNEQLMEPIMQRLAGPWESVFARRMPGILTGFPLNAGKLLASFHDDLEKQAVREGAPMASFQMLKQQIPVHKEALKDAAAEARAQLTEGQRNITREFEPKLTEHMVQAYDTCVAEAGPGQYARMKGHMDRHVEQEKHRMFEATLSHGQGLLKKLLDEVQEALLTKVDNCFIALGQDYVGVIVGQEGGSGSHGLTREQRNMRKSVLGVIDGAELKFKRAVGLESEPTPKPDLDAGVGLDAATELDTTTAPVALLKNEDDGAQQDGVMVE